MQLQLTSRQNIKILKNRQFSAIIILPEARRENSMDGISGISSPALSDLTKAQPQTMASEVGTVMLGKSLELMQTMGDSMTKMMEQSVTPHIGGNIDFTA